MVSMLTFKDREEMEAYLAEASRRAYSQIHPRQHALTYGDYWVRFVDLADRHIEFGRIARLQEVRAEAEGDEDADADEVVERTQALLDDGYMYGIAHSRYNPEGEWGHTHKSVVWPIERSVFYEARDCGFAMDRMPEHAKINLQAAYLGFRTHRGVA